MFLFANWWTLITIFVALWMDSFGKNTFWFPETAPALTVIFNARYSAGEWVAILAA
jgi:hypothetical protein